MAKKKYVDFPKGIYDTTKIFLQSHPVTGALEQVNLPAQPDVTKNYVDTAIGNVHTAFTDTFTTDTDYTYTISTNTIVTAVIIDSTASFDLNIGKTANGSEILYQNPITANEPEVIPCWIYAKANTSIYFSGITGPTKIIILKTITP